MKKVWAYTGEQTLDHPVTIKMIETPIIHADLRPLSDDKGQSIKVWVENPGTDYPEVTRYFQVFGTGAEIPDYADHLKTIHDGDRIWHLYEIPTPS